VENALLKFLWITFLNKKFFSSFFFFLFLIGIFFFFFFFYLEVLRGNINFQR